MTRTMKEEWAYCRCGAKSLDHHCALRGRPRLLAIRERLAARWLLLRLWLHELRR